MEEKATVKQKKKANWLQWVMMLGYMVIGGFFGVLMIQTMEAASQNDASEGKVMLLWLVLMVSMYLIMFLQIVLHEAGHLIFGLATGYRFVSFRVGSLMLVKNEQGYRLRKLRLGGTGGQCLLEPPPMVDGKMPNVLYNLGGSLMNLLVGIVCLIAALCCPAGSVGRAILLLSAVVGIMYALMNALPIKGEIDNDGRNALYLSKNPKALEAFRTQLVINKLSSEGMRLKDMPQEHFVWPAAEDRSNGLIATIAVFCANRLMDEHRFEECAAQLDELLNDTEHPVPVLYQKLCTVDRMYLHLLAGENEAATALMTKELKQFLKAMKGQPPVHRTEYAYAILAEDDAAKAKKQLAAFDAMAKNYPHEQEIAAERELIALAQKAKAQQTSLSSESAEA